MVFYRNPERETLLLEYWKKGATARETAEMTGVPEGSVYHYWRKFNRDPEKANRLAMSLEPREEQSVDEFLSQYDATTAAEDFQNKYDELIKQGKYADAESYARAEREARHHLRELLRGANSVYEFLVKQEAEKKKVTLGKTTEAQERKAPEKREGILEFLERAQREGKLQPEDLGRMVRPRTQESTKMKISFSEAFPLPHDQPMPSDTMGQGQTRYWPGPIKKKSSGKPAESERDDASSHQS